jgi:tRNA threonylcarbamoyladenosine biosynthesis protein TsaB
MNVLAWDTATPATTVALGDVELRHDPAPGARPGHAGELLPLVERVVSGADGGWGAVDRIAVGTGPGSFTGLRIGVAAARALALARSLPLVGVSSLHALASAAGRDAELVLGVLDARRGEAFVAGWRAGEPVLAPAALEPGALAAAVAALPAAPLAVGDGAVRYRAALERAGALVPEDGAPLHGLSAREVARLGADASAGNLEDVVPEYIRSPDAVPR